MNILTESFRLGTRMIQQTLPRPRASEPPLRSELFSIDQLERHAKTLAANHTVVIRWISNRLLDRLDENEEILSAFTRTSLAVDQTRSIAPAAEWLLDNFYLIEEQIQLVRRHLPKGYNRELPCLLKGPSTGLPRVYDIVLELISHLDAQIDVESLQAFIAAYQTVSPLKLGELWAIPIMLRMALIENVRRVTTRLSRTRLDCDLALSWINRLRDMTETSPSRLVIVVAEMAESDLPLSSSFVAEFFQNLSRENPVLHLARGWLEQRLAEHGLSIEQLVHQESQNQAADQVSIRHSITSLRSLSTLDWKEFVEDLSSVDWTLRNDPAAIYGKMDFATRDRYRHAVESLSRHGSHSETEVAQLAIKLAEGGARKKGAADRTAHVGYYLVDNGECHLRAMTHVRFPLKTVLEEGIRKFPLTFYLGGIGLFTGLATLEFMRCGMRFGIHGWKFWIFSSVFLLGMSQISVALMNLLSTLPVKPRLLPRLDYSSGIAPDCETLVVIPTLLTRLKGAGDLLEKIEIHYLANRDARIHFALLTDFGDALEETLPQDGVLLERTRSGIEMLNEKYAPGSKALFFLFHRPRRWNARENVWMGYERKRGKLLDLNGLLRNNSRENFSEIVGDVSVLSKIKYVITLDTDTQMPRDAARKLVGTMAHPLNRPEFDPARGIVQRGYGILQPRLGVSLPSAGQSWFVKIFAAEAGIDPYTRTVSDVYQDVFQEGSFIGKGIYDVDAFQQALTGRFPENKILSHDLLESCHARSALVSDVEFYEEHPSRHNVDVLRRHRWIRGDWQIAQWLLPRVPRLGSGHASNPLSLLSCWKIFDNLRRSLIPIALLFFLIGSWGLAPGFSGIASLLVLAMIAFPGASSWIVGALRKPRDLPWRIHFNGILESGARQLAQIFLGLAFLPYEAFISLDAVGKTLLRLFITRKKLLQWQTTSDSENTLRTDLGGFYSSMGFAPFICMLCGFLFFRIHPAHVPSLLAIVGIWLVSPVMAWWISRPIPAPAHELTETQWTFLRQVARKTWSFFETFVTAQENWLPPDNFQEIVSPVIASRTSPTNMGLALLANLGARDLGYLSTGRLMERTQNAFTTMQKLERYRGHFYNWYDTRTLQPLLPRYVSSVDSGNLAGHLLTLGSGLRELADAGIFTSEIFPGLRDTVGVLKKFGNSPLLSRLEAELAKTPSTLRGAYALLKRTTEQAVQIYAVTSTGNDSETVSWRQTLMENCEGHLEEMLFLAPWLALPDAWEQTQKHDFLDRISTLREMAALDPSSVDGIGDAELLRCFREGCAHARERMTALESLAQKSDAFAAMDFTFLYDNARDLFATGFNVTERRLDASFYDILASEARLCSYVAIAQGQIIQDHWFSMGRLLVAPHGDPILISWSGSMFEYLMPLLVMPGYDSTLLDHSCKAAVRQQIEYGKLRGVPWGISESAYNRTDVNLNYQYRAFGVPGLGLQRGLSEDLVIAPYATVMALMIAPRHACENLQRLRDEGREGAYGFYEAVDYTPSRMPPQQSSVTIRSFMAHHQGMSLLSLVSLLRDQPMQRRFMACPALKAAELLLHERVPKTAAQIFSANLELEESPYRFSDKETALRVSTNPTSRTPEIHLLSNGHYHVMISSAGGGYSRWNDLAITRWREDPTRDCWGNFVYLRDAVTGELWSATHQPVLRSTKHYEAIFTQGRAEFRHRHAGFEIHTEICVSPEDDVELRRIKITNHSQTTRTLELTSYSEVVLAPPAADAAHPAFSNLFVETEFVPSSSALLCARRPRSQGEKPPWLLHVIAGQGGQQGGVSCETDRSRFIGRGGNLTRPAAMHTVSPLSNTVGPILDPVVSLRRTLILAPNETGTVVLTLGVAESREAALALVEKYQNPRMADRAFELTWTHSQVTLRHLDASETDAQLYAQLASALIYADSARRASPVILAANKRGQSGLWSYGISGDLPIVLLRISDAVKIEIVRQLIRAHSYWHMKGLIADLVILNENRSVYRQSLHDQIIGMISSGMGSQMLEKPGGIFVRRLEQVSDEDRLLLQSVARVVLDDESGDLGEQLEQNGIPELSIPVLASTRSAFVDVPKPLPPRELLFHNGLGGFTRDGHEYVITLEAGQTTPAPWVNVIANANFGTMVSESGSAYTWSENAHEFRLTPWNNDAVQDSSGEAFYIRDEHTGQFWSPTPLPARGTTPYVIRHGFGYTVFEHTEHGIASELWIYIATDAAVKFAILKLRNVSGRPRRLSATGYWEWVLGDLRHKSLLHVQTGVDLKTGALLARNHYNADFPERTVFIDVNDPSRTLTGSRREFVGRNGNLAQPAALKRMRLSGKTGAGLDPCGAVQVAFDLEEGQEHETRFHIGVGRNTDDVHNLIQRFRRAGASHEALQRVWDYWNRTLGVVNVETPDASVNVMANGWLLYQTLSCRVWGRTGFYQSGGAFGFRDQLQDVMALVHAEPALTREHLLRAAAHQFREGDVQHWWHPPMGRGVRTHFSDDYLWLPYAVCRYVRTLGDTGVLDEKISFLEGRPVKPDEEAYYDLPHPSEESATLYQHCVRAIEHGLKFGSHGLPLIGCGDWNDGMNLVGKEGRGESVWLAFFLHEVLTQFTELAQRQNDSLFAERCLSQADALKKNIAQHGWDGQWYRRAYFDNGEPLGSQTNPECQIDSLPQSWSVISGAGDPDRSRLAMKSVQDRLVRNEDGLILLFDPPFDHSPLNPGYIKGYIPGVRENGGQYTHAAIWTIMATAMMGDHEKAWKLFDLLNPVHHGSTAEQMATYKVEPYVAAADVYGLAPHTGMGGWTWYTGSAGWMYRLLVETLLGLNLEGEQLRLTPRFPKGWDGFKIHYRHRQTQYHITFERIPGGAFEPEKTVLDGVELNQNIIPLSDDGREHFVLLRCPYEGTLDSQIESNLKPNENTKPTGG